MRFEATSPANARIDWRVPAGAACVVALYLGLSVALALTDRPGADEGHQDPFGASYRPVTRLIEAATPVGGLVMGEGGLLFGLYPDRELLDDSALGLRSGRVPDAIVIEGFYKLLHGYAGPESEVGRHVKRVLTGYQLICNDGYHEVYARPGAAGAPGSCPGPGRSGSAVRPAGVAQRATDQARAGSPRR